MKLWNVGNFGYMKLCIYKTMFVCLSVCLFPKNSKPTSHINLKFCMYTIYDNESEISYLKLTSEVALSNFPPAFSEVGISLNNQTQPCDDLCHD